MSKFRVYKKLDGTVELQMDGVKVLDIVAIRWPTDNRDIAGVDFQFDSLTLESEKPLQPPQPVPNNLLTPD